MRPATTPILLSLTCLAFVACTSILGNDFEVVAGDGGTGGTGGGGGSVGGTGGTGNYGGSTGDGPQLVGSSPENGEENASLVPFGHLFFDRPVNVGDATGKIRVSHVDRPDGEVAQVEACPDANPSCIRYVVPTPLTQDARLLGGMTYTVVVDRTFPDPDDNTNDVDASIAFTTFGYNPDFFSDMAINDELGGLVYVGQVGGTPLNTIYASGEGFLNNSGPDVVQVPLDGNFHPTGVQAAASPNFNGVGTCNNNAPHESYGLDRAGDRLFLAVNFCAAVMQLTIDSDTGVLDPNGGFSNPSLPSPNDGLYRVDSMVAIPDGNNFLYYFGSGIHGSGPVVDGVLWYRPLYMVPWEIWVGREGLFDTVSEFYLTATQEGSDWVIYLVSGDTILKLAQADGTELNRQVVEGKSFQNPGLQVDSAGRLYVGDEHELVVYDTHGFNGFSVLAVRNGLDFRRIALREEGSLVHVYFNDFRGPLHLKHLVLEL